VGTRRSVRRRAGDVVGNPFFSGAVAQLNSIDDYTKVAIRRPREICMVEGHTRIERGMCVAVISPGHLVRD
jgi:Trk K+ transport system NAD-binding subunit